MLYFQHDRTQIRHQTALHRDSQTLFLSPRAQQQQKVAHNL